MTKSVGKLRKLVGLRWGLPFVRQADRHREHGDWIEAMLLYRRGLEWMPWREDLKIQVGNCLKEYGDYEGAARVYRSVTTAPSRMEAQAQLLDANRRAGNVLLPYAIGPEPTEAEAQTRTLPSMIAAASMPGRLRLDHPDDRRWLGTLGRAAEGDLRIRGGTFATIKLDQVGAMALERDHLREPVLSGVVAIRGRIMALGRLASVQILQGRGVAEKPVAEVRVSQAGSTGPLKLFVFNAWIDSAQLTAGRSWLSVRAGEKDTIPPAGLFVNVVPADVSAPELRVSSSLVPSPPPGTGVEAAVIAAPAEIRPAARSVFERPIRSILVIRADQLGDCCATLPAMRRLRVLFPDARITALVQPAVAAVIEASGVIDDIETLALDYDRSSERRHLSPAEERRVRPRLGRYDLAIDLCPGGETRPLLLLSEAVYMVGFEPDRWPFLDFGISVRSRDKVNRLDKISHTAQVLSLVEALAVAIDPTHGVVRRAALDTPAVEAEGLAPGRYVVLHTGARHALNQWPLDSFAALAAMILERSDLPIVLFGEEGPWLAPLLAEHSTRVRLLPTLDLDAFDQIMSSARVTVGNDSGPKHLSAVRGVPTVSVHVARLNWNEWGQEGVGAIVAKRVPCAGCGLNDIALCGREVVCLRSITVDEVFTAVRPFL